MPTSIEAFSQEIGRAGRDGGPAACTLLYRPEDLHPRPYPPASARAATDVRARAAAERFILSGGCRHQQLAAHFGEQIDECRRSCDRCLATRGILESVLPPSASPTVSAPEPILAARVDRLRSIRRRLAAEHGVPAYVVFSDATLRALARSCPSTLAQIAAVPGLGAVKVTAFGDAILAAVRET